MKALPKLIALTLALLMATPAVWSQEPDSTSLARLRIEIRKLEAAAKDAPFELREINDGFLASRRLQLKKLLRQRLATLERYADSVQAMLNAQERKDLESAMEELRLELNENKEQLADVPTERTVARAETVRSNPVAASDYAKADDRNSSQQVRDHRRQQRGRDGERQAADTPGIEIKVPSDSGQKMTGSPAQLQIQVNDSAQQIKELYVLVTDEPGKKVDEQTVKVDYNNKGLQKLRIKIAKGENDIKIIPYVKDGSEFRALDEVTTSIECEGDDCGKSSEAAKAAAEEEPGPFSGRNARMIVGFEQSGAASASSVTKPFLDFFINTPIPLGHDRNSTEVQWPRLSLWGDIRLASSPQQVTAFGAAATGPLAAFTSDKQNELVSGFDFSAGPELRLVRAGRTHVSLIAGFGAISPLSYKQSAPIFKVPATTNPQYAQFVKDFPGAVGKDFIAFVPPDRDRFLRHYFGGFRFRTYQYAKDANYASDPPLNRFPAMLDVTLGQSEAVTGGKLRKFVVNLDGFYPLPFPKDTSLLYLFGTAKFIAGGRKTIKTPYILDTAESSIQLTNDKLFISDQTSNRDYYRIGFGVDLIELFKLAKKSGKEPPKEGGN